MGFMRKGLFVATGGLSGAAGIKANSKKDRAAKAAEKQVRLQRQMLRTQQTTVRQQQATITGLPRAAILTPAPVHERSNSAPKLAVDPLERIKQLGELRDAGVLTDAEFEAKKAELLARI